MDKKLDRDIASPSHQRPPFADPLAGGIDPTSPGAPHEPGGTDYRQSKEQENAALNAKPDHGDGRVDRSRAHGDE